VSITHGYCTLEQLREQFKDPDGLLDVALLERAINATSRAIDKPTGRRFWLDDTATARTYRPRSADGVWVHDIASTTGLIVQTDTTGDGSWATTWERDVDYELSPTDAAEDGRPWTRLVAIGDKRFIPGRDGTRPLRATLKVTAKRGFAEVPVEVEQACILKAAKLFKRKDSPEGFASGFGDFGPVRISKFEDPDVWALIEPLIRYALPEL
jgi:hypothetical protein